MSSGSVDQPKEPAWSSLIALFEAFYGVLVLRDIFGKVLPGSVVLVSLTWKYRDSINLVGWAPWSWLFIVAMSWILAFAIQSFGECVWIIRYYPKKPKIGTDQLGFSKDQDWYVFTEKFGKASDQRMRQTRERFVIIKEACGNMCVALAVALIKVALDVRLRDWTGYWPHIPSVALTIGVIILLFRMHRIHVDREAQYMKTVVDNE